MKYLSTLIIIFSLFSARASHIVGGDIYYDYLGNNNYRFYISVYRDCNSTGAAYDDPLMLAVYNSNDFLVDNVAVPFPGSTILPVIFNNPCVTPPNNICVEKAVYTTVINLPPTPGGYTISYQRCCRGPNITNLVNPDDTGLTLTTHVPGSETNATVNSSPRFTNYPPLLLCNNDDLVFNHAATDPDGDQLVYSLVTPFTGGSSGAPLPNPAAPPNYFPVNWTGGFSAANPLGPGATININPTTGVLTASPQMLGLFVVGIRVQEYRNGVLIGETIRDFLFKVFNCDITMQALLPEQEDLPTFVSYCQGLTVVFENNSYGGTNYSWNFGVNGTTTDVSAAFEPTFTYPAPGTYQAMLVVNPGWPCTDTAYMDLILNNQLSADFSVQDSVCILNNNLDFTGITDGPPATTFLWDFGPNANPSTASTQNVNNVSFNTTGFIPVSVTTNNGSCEATYEDSIYIFPLPNAGIVLPTNYECDGLTIPFGNNSTGTFNYSWDFGVSGTTSDISTLTTPAFTFPTGGTYTITLIGSSTAACSDTTTETITVYEPLTIDFTNNDSLCILDNSFNFDGSMTGPSITTYLWDFGLNASLPSSTNLDVNGVVFDTFGSIPITLTASFNSCSESVTHSIFIYREPSINFGIEPGNRCVPALVDFTDLSVADSPIFYNWNFGDGGTSTLSDPSHLYTTPGSYSVGLTINTTEGCIDTLNLFLQDTVVIHPSPVSNFNVDPKQTDICHADITFSDLSIGASGIFYWFDDSTAFSNEANIIYTYQTSGWQRPMQIATNEWGCKDTSYQELYIEPFIIYAPNTFTPDGNEVNNDFNALFALEVYEWELRIYNRWGQMVYESLDPNFGWDGSYLGKLIQEGTYAYTIRYVSCEKPDSWQILTGHVNLLK
jgi:gliding motility-associated-like protein